MFGSKPDLDLVRLRKSADLVGRTLAEVAKHIRPGVTTRELDTVADNFIRSNGARPAFKGYDPGWGGGAFAGACCMSVNEIVVHGIPSDRPLENGDLLTVDTGVELNGYFGDSAYTFAIGEITDEQRRLLRVTYESLDLGVAQAVTGRRTGDIGHAIQQHCEAAGYGVVRELVGHGIGRTLHGPPNVPNYGQRGVGRKLKEGMALCIEPMISAGTYEIEHGPDKWAVLTADRAPAAHYEHMVVVRGGKPDVLTTFAYVEAVIEAPYKEPVGA